MFEIEFAKLTEFATIPTKKYSSDAGYDLYSSVDIMLYPHSFTIVNTGIILKIPKGLYGRILPKSRNNWLIGAGVVDQEYQGEILVKIVNVTNDTMMVRKGDPIAQIIFQPFVYTTSLEVSKDEIHKENTVRGKTGGIVTQLELLGNDYGTN